MRIKKKKLKVSVPEAVHIPSEHETLRRIEAVTDRLEWLAKEIEYQLQQSGGRSNGE